MEVLLYCGAERAAVSSPAVKLRASCTSAQLPVVSHSSIRVGRVFRLHILAAFTSHVLRVPYPPATNKRGSTLLKQFLSGIMCGGQPWQQHSLSKSSAGVLPQCVHRLRSPRLDLPPQHCHRREASIPDPAAPALIGLPALKTHHTKSSTMH